MDFEKKTVLIYIYFLTRIGILILLYDKRKRKFIQIKFGYYTVVMHVYVDI